MFDIFYFNKPPKFVPNARKVDSIEQAYRLACTRYFWIVDYLCDYSTWDFLWEPSPWEGNYMHAFASQWQKDSGTYLVPSGGYTDTKYNDDQVTRLRSDINWDSTDFDFDYSWHPDPTEQPYIYQFGTQWQKTGGPRYVLPDATEIKYVNRPRVTKTSVDNHWEVPDNIDFSDFDYTWHPDATDEPYIYQFGTQHQKTGGPRYVMPDANAVKYIDQIRIKAEKFASGAIVIDHFDGNSQAVVKQIKNNIDVLHVTRYFNNYKDTLKRALSTLEDQEFVWVVSSVCNYEEFDFSWHPEVWQIGMLHVFPSNEQKFGDTFFVHVPTFLDRIDSVDLLEWYNCNFVEDITVPRRELQQIKYTDDNLADALRKNDFKQPLVQFYKNNKTEKYPTVSLWRDKTKTIVPLSADSSTALVPRESKVYISKRGYDYPYINKKFKHLVESQPQDIIFISYDETNADQNFEKLQKKFSRSKRLHGVEGMINAIKKAADISETPFYYVVWAKTEIHDDFNFDFTPDYLSEPCNYLFHGKNMSNDLVYGTLAVTMYNAKIIAEAKSWGIDFTTSFPLQVVPKLSALGYFATDPYRAWRTAFRECTKLQAKCIHKQVDVETEHRLHVWTTFAKGDNAEWVLAGASDGVEYAKSVDNSLSELYKINDWNWLKRYFATKYPGIDLKL